MADSTFKCNPIAYKLYPPPDLSRSLSQKRSSLGYWAGNILCGLLSETLPMEMALYTHSLSWHQFGDVIYRMDRFILRLTGRDVCKCPFCKQGTMHSSDSYRN